MNAHIRLVSSETVAEDANIHDAHENAEGRDEAPIGLPEEGGSNRNDILGEAPPPLVAEPEDRAVGAREPRRTKKGVAKLIALVWRPKSESARAGCRRRRPRASGRRGRRPALRRLSRALTASRKSRPPRGTIILSLTTVRVGTAPRSRPPPKQSVRS